MPQDYGQIELERDSIEKRIGKGHRPDQEMAKSPALPGERVVNPWPHGMPPEVAKHKRRITKQRVGAEITEVRRRGVER